MPSTSRSSTGFLHETFDFLRLPGEPCVHFGEREIHDVLVKRGTAFMDLLEDFYRRWKDDATLVRQPRKTIFSSEGVRGDWRVMPCVVRRRAGPDVKAVKVVGTNEEERVVRDKISVGRALLLHPTDHFVQATFDVGALSSFRTAALGVLAWRHAGRGVVPVGLAGAGRIGFYTALLLADWGGVTEGALHDPRTGRAAALRELLEERMALEVVAAEALVRRGGALFLATDASDGVLRSREAGELRFVSSVGADADNLSELDAGFPQGWRLVSESRQNVHVGDMRRWRAAGILQPGDVEELRHVVDEPARSGERTLFVSTGTAVQDALLCQFLFDALRPS